MTSVASPKKVSEVGQIIDGRLHTYTIKRLGQDIDAIVAQTDDQYSIVEGVRPLLARFLSSGEQIREDFCTANNAGSGPDGGEWLTDEQRIMREVKVSRIYRGAGGKFVIMATVWPVGSRTGVHDHNDTWVVEGGYRNKLLLKTFERLDDRSKPGYADLKEVDSSVVKPGDIGYVVSPDRAIHDYANPYDAPAVTINIYGAADPTHEACTYFDLDAKTCIRVAPFDVPYYDDVSSTGPS